MAKITFLGLVKDTDERYKRGWKIVQGGFHPLPKNNSTKKKTKKGGKNESISKTSK
tara:strand:+ start:138 stop:305 length:168 start_codon:yes stop_codon:yes gene_type:complete